MIRWSSLTVVLALYACADVFDIETIDPPPADMMCTTGFCIDRTEVTKVAYQRFLDASPPQSLNHAACAGNDFTPNGTWPPSPGDQRPVVNVDWCDAFAFCAWAEKRLCGAIGGGPVAPSDNTKIAYSQWYYACTGGHQDQPQPYGVARELGRCNDSESGGTEVVGVLDNPGCEGGLPQLLDMVGNVHEWEDACDSELPTARCMIRGGDWFEKGATCGMSIGQARTDNTYSRFGFRCCSDR